MSWLSKAGLLLTGAATGYFVSRRGERIVRTAQELVVRDPMEVSRRENEGGAVSRAWASPALAPLRRGALGALKFAAEVKQGMAEREAELHEKYAQQKKDLRPGSLDTWDRPAEAPARLEHSASDRPAVLDHEQTDETAAGGRDADLPPDFFRDGRPGASA